MDEGARIRRLFAAGFAAPLLGGSACTIVLSLLAMCPGQSCDVVLLSQVALAGAFGGLIVGIPAMLLFGMPAHAWLWSTGRKKIWHYAIAGVLVGVLTSGAIAALYVSPFGSGDLPFPRLAIIGSGTGAVSAVVFWLIRRPDRDEPNPPTPTP